MRKLSGTKNTESHHLSTMMFATTPLARNLVTLAVAVACEVIVTFITTQQQQSFTVTLGDFAIQPFTL